MFSTSHHMLYSIFHFCSLLWLQYYKNVFSFLSLSHFIVKLLSSLYFYSHTHYFIICCGNFLPTHTHTMKYIIWVCVFEKSLRENSLAKNGTRKLLPSTVNIYLCLKFLFHIGFSVLVARQLLNRMQSSWRKSFLTFTCDFWYIILQ